MFYGRWNFFSRWSEKKVFNTSSDFALKILSLHSLTNSVFQYSEGLIQINCGPTYEWESPNRFCGRKNCCSSWSEKKVFNTSGFALKILSLHSLTNSVFQYSEGLIKNQLRTYLGVGKSKYVLWEMEFFF